MRIGFGSDHRGFKLKELLKKHVSGLGHRVEDFGCFAAGDTGGHDAESCPRSRTDSGHVPRVDYPDFAFAVAKKVGRGRLNRGILICSSGIGMSIAANKVKGVRAALCCNVRMAIRSREHNNANVLCLGADFVSAPEAKRIVRAWFKTEFEGGRHLRRLGKISDYSEVKSQKPRVKSQNRSRNSGLRARKPGKEC